MLSGPLRGERNVRGEQSHSSGGGQSPLGACGAPRGRPSPQCESGDPPLGKVAIFSRGMKSFLIPCPK